MRRHRQHKTSRGSAAVEFALLLPVLVLLIMGVIECGNMFFSWLTVQKAAGMATRFAATGQGELEGDRLTRVLAAAQGITGELPGTSTIRVRSWPTPDTSGDGLADDPGGPCDIVEVSVTYLYTPVTPIVGAAMPEVVALTSADRKVNEPWRPCTSSP